MMTKIEGASARLKKMIQPLRELKGQTEDAELLVQAEVDRNQKVHDDMQQFQKMITPENKDQVEALRSLVYLSNNLSKQKQLFQENCQKTRASLKEKIKLLKEAP